MSSQLAVIAGLGIISTLFAYYAFEFRNSTQELLQKFSVFLFFVSLVFVDLVMYSIYYIANNEGLAYLSNGVIQTGLLVLTWTTVLLTFVLLLVILYMLIMAFKNYFQKIGRQVDDATGD